MLPTSLKGFVVRAPIGFLVAGTPRLIVVCSQCAVWSPTREERSAHCDENVKFITAASLICEKHQTGAVGSSDAVR